MPLRETIGAAYVRILADGAGFDDSVRDQLDEHDDAFESGGRRHARAYQEGFADQMEETQGRGSIRRSFEDAVRRGAGRMDALGEQAGAEFWDGLQTQLRREVRVPGGSTDIADRIFENLRNDFRRGRIDLNQVMESVSRDLIGNIERATRDLVRVEREANAALAREARELQEQLRQAERETDEARRRSVAEFRAQERERQQRVAGLVRETNRLTAATRRLRNGEETGITVRRTLIRQVRDLQVELRNAGGATHEQSRRLVELETQLRRTGTILPRVNRNIDRFADGMGRAFGRGARNDAVNLFGSIVRGTIRLAGLLPKLTNRLFEFGRSLQGTFTQAGGGISGLIASIGATAPLLLVGVTALVAGLTALLVIIGPLVAALSLLLGVITALAASLTFALLGAIGAVAGALLPLAAAIGVVVLAVKDMSKETQQAFKPLGDAFSELQDIAGEELFKGIGDSVKKILPLFELLEPLVRAVARATRQAAEEFVNLATSPAVINFLATMQTFLPNAIRDLGTIFANTLGGVLGIFTALSQPGGITERFLNWLVDITEQFSEWANSKQGQEDLVDFFERAGDSASALGGLMGQLVGLFGDLFDSGAESGDSIIEKMTNAIEKFREFLAEDDGERLKEWFEDAERFAVSLGNVAVAAGELSDALDNETTRSIANLIEKIAPLIGFLARVITKFEQWSSAWGPIKVITDVFPQRLDQVRDAVGRLSGRIGDAIGALGRFRTTINTSVLGALDNFRRRAQEVGGAVVSRLNAIPRDLSGLGGRIVSLVSDVPGRILRLFQGLGKRVLSAIGDIDIETLIELPSLSSIAGHFVGLAGDILSAIGTIDIGSLIRLPSKGSLLGQLGSGLNPLDRLSAPSSGKPDILTPLSALGRSTPTTIGGKTIDVGGITIVTPTEDPKAVATEVVNVLVASAY